jgi:hypothetical protein
LTQTAFNSHEAGALEMNYTVKRDLQEFGPYSLAELQRYVSTGNVLLTDLCRSEGMTEWMPVSQVIGTIPVPVVAPAPVAGPPAVYYPPPPNLHWGLVLVIGIVTCGVFAWVWAFVEASWVKKVDPSSKAIIYYAIGTAALLVAIGLSVSGDRQMAALGTVINLGGAIIFLVAAFSMRSSIENHFNTAEPIGLALSGVMTFFFSVYYFQYHFTQINEMKARQAMGIRP